jgi:hypothetical protein
VLTDRKRIVKSFVLAVFLAAAPALSMAAPAAVDVPLHIDLRYLHGVVAEALGLDANGQGRVVADPCNRLDLAEPQLAAGDEALELSLAVSVHTGAMVFGRCTGPRPISGRFHVEMQPGVRDAGRTLVFDPVGAEIRRSDGSAGLVARAASVLADQLLVPRLAETRIDLAESLAAIDGLIEEFLPATEIRPSPLAERARLLRVATVPEGLVATLSVALHPMPEVQRAPEAPLDESELAQWQRIEDELDGFLTAIIVYLADGLDDRALQLDLLAVLVDSRQRIAEALAADTPDDPVEALFLDAWQALRPLLARQEKFDTGDDIDLRLAGFLAAGDALTALRALGPEYGLEINRDGLRRLARMLLADRAPMSFTPLPLEIDPKLRGLFDMRGSPGDSTTSGSGWLGWLIPSAHAAAESPAESLRGLVPRLAILDDYLLLVEALLAHEIEAHLAGNNRLRPEHRKLFAPLVRATAWKETCWRHYVGGVEQPEVIRSPVGAVGMMQIMGRVWRGVYDIERLEDDVQYNVAAGIQILEHYLFDYAVRRGEYEYPGGVDNLVRATYAAYNGGPSHLSRYRSQETPGRLRAIDREFWQHYEQMKTQQWPNVASCYPVGG